MERMKLTDYLKTTHFRSNQLRRGHEIKTQQEDSEND